MERDYAAWVAGTNSCTACGIRCASAANEFLINERVRAAPCRAPLPLPVVPQAGYLGPRYESQKHRFMVLGLNPAGAWDGHLFYLWQAVLAASSVTNDVVIADHLFRAAGDQLMSLVSGPEWKHLRSMQLFSILDPRDVAYANQVLCRTTLPASGLPNWAARQIRATCWEERVCELIRILAPDTIVAIGIDWGTNLVDLVAGHQWSKQIEVVVVPFPNYGRQDTAHSILKSRVEQVKACHSIDEFAEASDPQLLTDSGGG